MRAIPFFSVLGLIGLLSGCTAKLITPPPGPIALSGVVQLARVRNATVQAFALSESGAIASTALAETLTNENGEFQLSLPAGTGPVVIRSSGGKYENEADGVETDASELSNIVDASKTSLAPVTALTTLAKERTLELLESSGSLENAQQAAKAQVGQLFGLSAAALDAIPAPPKAVTMSNGVNAVQGALALAALSHFMKSYFPSKTISEVMSALIQDIKTDGSLNGDNEAGNLQSSLAQSLAFRWNTQRAHAVTAAKLNPNLAFKDFNLVEVSSLSFESQGLLHKTVVEGVYYLGGVKTTLPESGTGVWNDMFYSLGELGSGFFEGNCYVDGADTMSLVGGSGFCAADLLYYIAGVAQPGLNESGTGQSQVDSLYYSLGALANGYADGACYNQGVDTYSMWNGSGFCNELYYSQGAIAHGYVAGACYNQGVQVGGIDWSGTGFCSADSIFYLNGSATSFDSNGRSFIDNKLHSLGQIFTGFHQGRYYLEGNPTAFVENSFAEATVAPNDPTTLFVHSTNGVVYRSTDSGASWKMMCSRGVSINLNYRFQALVVSKGSDKTAYLSQWESLVKVTDNGGGNCLDISPELCLSHYGAPNLDSESDGTIYKAGHLGGLYKSQNQGTSWTKLSVYLENPWSGGTGNILIDPFNNQRFLLTPLWGWDVVARSTDGGLTFTQKDNFSTWSNKRFFFDPQNQGYVYTGVGQYSSDGGETWLADSRYNSLETFTIASDGAGYRLRRDGEQTVVEKANDMRDPVWVPLSGGVLSAKDDNWNFSRLSVSGNTILAVVNLKAFISTNGGVSFSEISIPLN